MKQIKLKGTHTINEDDARQIIADLQAQLDAPEPVEFWEGQLCQFSDDPMFVMQAPVGVFLKTRIEEGINTFVMSHFNRGWKYCRPLQDPLILQFKAHKPGDPMPCGEGLDVRVLHKDNEISLGVAKYFNWHHPVESDEIIGWMPADGWGGGE